MQDYCSRRSLIRTMHCSVKLQKTVITDRQWEVVQILRQSRKQSAAIIKCQSGASFFKLNPSTNLQNNLLKKLTGHAGVDGEVFQELCELMLDKLEKYKFDTLSPSAFLPKVMYLRSKNDRQKDGRF